MEEERAAKPRRLSRERSARYRANTLRIRRQLETPEEVQARKDEHAAYRRGNKTIEETVIRRLSDAVAHRVRRADETMEEVEARRSSDAAAHRVRREQIQARQLANAVDYRMEDDMFDENSVTLHDCGLLNIACEFCQALHFLKEQNSDKKFSSCCHKGKIKLQKFRDENGEEMNYPGFLKDLLSNSNNPHYKKLQP